MHVSKDTYLGWGCMLDGPLHEGPFHIHEHPYLDSSHCRNPFLFPGGFQSHRVKDHLVAGSEKKYTTLVQGLVSSGNLMLVWLNANRWKMFWEKDQDLILCCFVSYSLMHKTHWNIRKPLTTYWGKINIYRLFLQTNIWISQNLCLVISSKRNQWTAHNNTYAANSTKLIPIIHIYHVDNTKKNGSWRSMVNSATMLSICLKSFHVIFNTGIL